MNKQQDINVNSNISINIDVYKIVKALCAASVMIIGIIFGAKCFNNLLGLFKKKTSI